MSEERSLSDIVWTPERGLAEPEVRGISWNNILLSDMTYDGKWRTDAGIRITPETSLQSTVVLACCRILAETISTLPLHVMRRLPNGGKERAEDIPLYKVLSFAPNAWQTKFEFFEQLVMTLCLWGNSYTLIKSGKYGAVTELDNLHPSNMDVERLENGRLRYSYRNPETGRLERYSQDQIMHVRWTPEPDGIKGMVPVEIGREAIALARACEIHASKFWANSARPGVVLQTDGTLSAEAAQQLRENWERLHRGVDSAYRTAILTSGLKATELGFTNEASQFTASRAFQSEEIARIYRLPLHLVQGQAAGNLEIAGQEFVTYTLVPWLKRIESSISRSLIYNDDLFYAEFDTRALMRGDSNSRAGYYSTMLNLGIYSINDCRALEGLAPIDNGSTHFIAMNVQPLSEAVKPKPDPMAAMMGGGPPPAQGGVPSLPQVKTGEPPREAEKGQVSEKKPEGDLVTWGDGNVGTVKHVMDKGTLDLKSGEKIEVKEGEPVALVEDESGKEHGVPVSQLKKVTREQAVEGRSADCGRQEGGKFGPKNDCASDGDAASPKAAAKSFPKEIAAGDPLLKKHVPFIPVEGTRNSDFAKPAGDDALKAAIAAAKGERLAERYGKPRELPDGSPVAIRIDVPTFKKSGAYAVTVHKSTKSGFDPSPVGYDSVARLDGPVVFESKEDDAALVASGLSQKFPLATVKGSFSKDRSIPDDIDDWTPVGYDPQKAAYFYDKRTGDEVTGGTDSVSVGNSVFVRKPTYAKNPRNAGKQYRSAGFWGLESRDCGQDEDGRFGSDNKCAAGGGGSESQKDSGSGGQAPKDSGTQRASTREIVEEVLRSIDATGGYSVHPMTANSPTTGYMVATVPDAEHIVSSKDEVTEQVVEAYFEKHKDYLSSRPSLHLGGWIDLKDGRVYLDLSERFETAEEAEAASVEHKQIAYWDIANKREVRVNRNGDNKRSAEADGEVRLRAGRVPQGDRGGDSSGASAADEGVRGVAGQGAEVRGLIAETISVSGSLPKIEVRDIGNAVAFYSAVGDTIYVSPDASRLEDNGWVSQTNPVMHELAHRHHLLADAGSYLSPRLFSPEERSMIQSEVSRYAATNSVEFVAEALSGYWNGRQFGDDIKRLVSECTNGKVSL